MMNSITKTVTVGGPPTNVAPTANFTYSCVLRPNGRYRCDVDGSSSTDDVGVVSYLWTAAGETDRTGVMAIYGLDAGSSASVTLTVTDGGGLTNFITKTISTP